MNSSNHNKKELIKKYQLIQEEHRNLDKILVKLQKEKTIDLLQIQKLKKRKLILKDKIVYLRNKIEPDIIA
tara:strand:- start:1736 stop:1948 length:213 start_codon:yes stop_codon:yes gene_type:complete